MYQKRTNSIEHKYENYKIMDLNELLSNAALPRTI